MQLPKATAITVSPKNVLGASALFLIAAAGFAALNMGKVNSLKLQLADRAPVAKEAITPSSDRKNLKAPDDVSAVAAKASEAEVKARKAEADLAQTQKEKSDLQARLQANESELAGLQKRLDEVAAKPADTNPGAASPAELQAQLEEARRLLDSAEREKAFLSEKLSSNQTRSVQPEQETKRREAGAGRLGLRGTVLAVNQAYNFVVLSLGGRQGVEANSEMLVLRSGTLIGKIRISSVEPTTAIGDIVTSSLARGVQVQPGDIVIYAGSTS
jgi:hypothetical protein